MPKLLSIHTAPLSSSFLAWEVFQMGHLLSGEIPTINAANATAEGVVPYPFLFR